MPFSPEWDALFRAGRNVGEWPWSDVVSLVYRYAKPSDGYRRVLELGPDGPTPYGGGYVEYVARSGHEAPGLH